MAATLTTIVDQYKAILPQDLYSKLYQAAEEVSEDMAPVMAPAFQIELHKACEGYFQALKSIGKEMQDDKKTFLKQAEHEDKQRELRAFPMNT